MVILLFSDRVKDQKPGELRQLTMKQGQDDRADHDPVRRLWNCWTRVGMAAPS